MSLRTLYFAAAGGLAGAAGYMAFRNAGLVAAVIVFVTASWLGWRFSGGEELWDTGGVIINPFTATLLAFGLGFSYVSLRTDITINRPVVATGVALLGAAAAIWLYRYWNIGEP